MKIEKNKIVVAVIILCVVLSIVSYSMIMFGNDEVPVIENNQIPVPKLQDEQKQYESKLEALDDLKEVRETNAPSIYDERFLDSTGVYDPNLLNKEKIRMVDSIYRHGRIDYTDRSYRKPNITAIPSPIEKDTLSAVEEKIATIDTKELGLEHQLFFSSNPLKNATTDVQNMDAFIYVEVHGSQTIKKNFRLQMRLMQDARINKVVVPKNTFIYGFVNFKPNRVMISIEHINHKPVKLKAYDLQDGSEGIYIENSFQAEARQEVVGDIVDDINIAGVPQITGVKKIFQRDNKNIKVTIANNYKLILKFEP